MKHAIIACIILATLANADDERLAELIKKLDDDKFEVRENAEKDLLSYCKASADIWSIGAQLVSAKKNSAPEIALRLSRVENEISLAHVPKSTDWLTFVRPGYYGTSHIDKTPLMVILINSLEMLRFYRPVTQLNFNQSLPSTDFSKFMLLGISGTDFGCAHEGTEVLITRYSFRRDFQKHGLNCNLSLTQGQTDGPNGGTTPGTGALNYTFSLDSLPLSISVSGPEKDSIAKTVWKYEECEADWKNADAIIKDRNVFAYRKLAEKLDGTIPALARRKFLQETYMTDPLLSYVMFTHMAKKHPALFREDYEYWKANLPSELNTGKLFAAALEEGKKIVSAKP